MVSFDSQAYSKKLLHLISWSHWFTFFNIIAVIGLSTVYLFNEAHPETLTGTLYLITTWLSHMAFLTFITFMLTVFPLTLVFPNTKFIRGIASIIFTFSLLLLLLDAFIYSRLGYHINASSAPQILDLISSEIQSDRRSFWFVSIVLCLIILSFELIASNYAWKHLKQLQKTIFARVIVFGLVICFFISHLTHMWADVNLEYDVLKQDSILPVSYPLTAKTLLTKYGLFNLDDYIERKTSPLSFNENIPKYPTLSEQCKVENTEQSVFIILSANELSQRQVNQFSERSSASSIKLNHHIDNALTEDAWFNLLFGLPSIYQQNIINQQTSPAILQATENANLTTSITAIGSTPNKQIPNWLTEKVARTNSLENISSLILSGVLNRIPSGLHIIYFAEQDPYQFELFIDALLHSQRKKDTKDIIVISSLGNKDEFSALANKQALMIWPNKQPTEIDNLTSQMDLSNTLLKHWLGCDQDLSVFSNGADLLNLDKNRVIANTVDNGLMVFDKDRSVLIDQNGNFQSYSRKLKAPISQKADFPLMIDGVHFIKQYSEQVKQSIEKAQ